MLEILSWVKAEPKMKPCLLQNQYNCIKFICFQSCIEVRTPRMPKVNGKVTVAVESSPRCSRSRASYWNNNFTGRWLQWSTARRPSKCDIVEVSGWLGVLCLFEMEKHTSSVLMLIRNSCHNVGKKILGDSMLIDRGWYCVEVLGRLHIRHCLHPRSRMGTWCLDPGLDQ